jgi:hypothetical protein
VGGLFGHVSRVGSNASADVGYVSNARVTAAYTNSCETFLLQLTDFFEGHGIVPMSKNLPISTHHSFKNTKQHIQQAETVMFLCSLHAFALYDSSKAEDSEDTSRSPAFGASRKRISKTLNNPIETSLEQPRGLEEPSRPEETKDHDVDVIVDEANTKTSRASTVAISTTDGEFDLASFDHSEFLKNAKLTSAVSAPIALPVPIPVPSGPASITSSNSVLSSSPKLLSSSPNPGNVYSDRTGSVAAVPDSIKSPSFK